MEKEKDTNINPELLLPLLMAVFAAPPANNIPLEKEVSYLHGVTDTLKELIAEKNK